MHELKDVPAPGDRIHGGSRTITEADLVAFGSLTGDLHPQHVDRLWAESSAFGSRIAHGMLVLSYSIGLVGFDPERVVALRGMDSVRFKRPVRIGETLLVEAVVRDVVPLGQPLSMVEFAWTVGTAESGTVVKARIRVLWRGEMAVPGPDDQAEGNAARVGDNGLYPNGVLL